MRHFSERESFVKKAENSRDVERIAEFNAAIFGPTTRELTFGVASAPGMIAENWLAVEGTSGEIIASLAMIPWRMNYLGAELRALEAGFIGTAPEHRGQGICGRLMGALEEEARAGAYDFLPIQGIRWYYRRFGYEYSIPLELNTFAPAESFPAEAAEGYTVRDAEPGDAERLRRLFGEDDRRLDLCSVRETADFDYLLGAAMNTEMAVRRVIVLDPEGKAVGTAGFYDNGFGLPEQGDCLIVDEAAALNQGALASLMRRIGEEARKRDKKWVRFKGDRWSPLAEAFLALPGGGEDRRYGWQLKIPDRAGLLAKLAAPLSERLLRAKTAAFVMDIDFFEDGARLEWNGARLQAKRLAGHARADVFLPPPVYTRLLFGDLPLDAILPVFPDIAIDRPFEPVIRDLFPPLKGWIRSRY